MVITVQQSLLTEFMTYAYKHLIKPDEKFFDISRVRAFQIVGEFTKKSGITFKNVHPHLFRHGFAVNYLNCGGLLPNKKNFGILRFGAVDMANTNTSSDTSKFDDSDALKSC